MRQFDAIIKSPIGYIGIVAEGDSVSGIRLNIEAGREHIPREGVAADAAKALKDYFRSGEWPVGISLHEKGTPFQKRVWKQLRSIRPGEALTYGDIARRLHSGPRAVGQACRANPCPLLTPCHRVVAASGTGGFSGEVDGAWPRMKTWLLRHEGYPA
jgi:methylated-DNA-[protein]-cysteine S-methyltransferase